MSKENIIKWIALCGMEWVTIERVLEAMQISPDCLIEWVRKGWVKGDYRLIKHSVKIKHKAIRKLKGKDTH